MTSEKIAASQKLGIKYFQLLQNFNNINISQIKREQIFIGVLEAVHPKDAELVISMINKKSPVKGLTYKIAQEAFPDL